MPGDSSIKNLVNSLHPLERKLIPFLKDTITLDLLKSTSNMQEIEIIRALQWLENKEVLKIDKKEREILKLDENGEKYLKTQLPERKILDCLKSKSFSFKDLKEHSKLDNDEVTVSIGILKTQKAINSVKNEFKINEKGKELLEKEFEEEKLLKRLSREILEPNSVNINERGALKELRRRKNIIKTEIIKEFHIELLPLGKKLLQTKIRNDFIEGITPELLKEKGWKGKDIRRYDVKINVPRIYPAKRHFVNQAIDYAKRVWMDMGFKEMQGKIVQNCFWDFDALFVPQDHPAREMQDTYFLKDPQYGKLPNKKIVENVKKAHEGGSYGSKGWGYKWDPKEATKLMLRTHTTVLSARTIASLKESDLPAKFFAIGKNFRNEAVDANHAFEFNQTEGIVIDPNANFRNLLGYLKSFANKMGYDKVRFRPAYFPYTEPSVEGDIYDSMSGKWIEVFAAGIFRPEVVRPLLGKDVSVLAWGPGFDRMIKGAYNLKDLRDLYKNDLKQLKEIKYWMK